MLSAATALTLATGVVLFWPLPKPDDSKVLQFLLRRKG